MFSLGSNLTRSLKTKTSLFNQVFSINYCTGTLKQTSLHSWHQENGGKMVEFAGYSMPVQYKAGVLKEHMATRNEATIFDVGHMGQLKFFGKDRVKFLEGLVVADLEALPVGSSTLSLFTNEAGGIIDDTVITNHGDHLYVVINAGCADKDLEHIAKHLKKATADEGKEVKLQVLNKSLIALQGPKAEEILGSLAPKAIDLKFMSGGNFSINGIDALITRCGYTGEDGFEISVENSEAEKLATTLIQHPLCQPAGLGARDSLRLEAGLCLYGNDLTESTTPAEATLIWTIGKRRRTEGGFLGSDKILDQINSKSSTIKRIGLSVPKGGAAREHTKIFTVEGKEIGETCSGTFSPVLKHGVSMAYLPKEYSKVGTEVHVNLGRKMQPAFVTKMPFVPNNYKTK